MLNRLAPIKEFIKQEIFHLPVRKYHIDGIGLGSSHSHFNIPIGLLNDRSVCYCVGAGEDITFDIALADTFKCNVFVIDPTPRAKIHFDLLMKKAKGEDHTPPPGSETAWEDIKAENTARMKFLDIGLWSEKTVLKFYEPQNEKHVSHSALNLQKTEKYFEAKVDRLTNIMKDLGHKTVDYLKLDVEGAEYEVIRSIVEDKPDLRAMQLEFDEYHYQIDNKFRDRITNALKSLIAIGYICHDYNSYQSNFSMIRRDVYDELKKKQKG